jgi:hypothetical protein
LTLCSDCMTASSVSERRRWRIWCQNKSVLLSKEQKSGDFSS